MKKEELKLHILFIFSGIFCAIIANLVEENVISKKWIFLAWIMLFVTFGIGTYGYITFTIPRYKKIWEWFKNVISKSSSIKEESLNNRAKNNPQKRKFTSRKKRKIKSI